jgi:V/A-type H+-transporting ATPase subunit I
MIMGGTALWLFSTHLQGEGGPRPAFLYEVAELSPTVGLAGLAIAAIGVVGFVMGEGAVGAIETPTVALVNVVSYTRLAAVLLAKAGMAFVVNLLAFGAYEHAGEVHFMLGGYHVPAGSHEVFPGLIWGGPAGVVGGILVLLFGHAVVLALGVTSAGLQAVRLEYVEFFGKFYEGGGEKYNPFGHQRNYTTED